MNFISLQDLFPCTNHVSERAPWCKHRRVWKQLDSKVYFLLHFFFVRHNSDFNQTKRSEVCGQKSVENLPDMSESILCLNDAVLQLDKLISSFFLIEHSTSSLARSLSVMGCWLNKMASDISSLNSSPANLMTCHVRRHPHLSTAERTASVGEEKRPGQR